MHHPLWNPPAGMSRRTALKRAGAGFGLLALAGLLEKEGLLCPDAAAAPLAGPLAPRPPHYPARAKAVIWLFMNGGPSQVDTWDYKPELTKRDGQKLDGMDKFTGFFANEVGPLMKSPFAFAQHGQSGSWVSEIFPNLAKHVDKMAFVHSLYTQSNNHSPQGRALRRVLGELWFGFRKPEPTRLRGDGRSAQSRPSEGLRPKLGGGIPAQCLPRHLSPAQRRAHR